MVLLRGGTAQPVSLWGCVQGRAPHPASWQPLCPQGWKGSRLAGLHPRVCYRWIWGVVLPAGCPGTHPARRRQLLPRRGLRGASGGQSHVPILAVRTRWELGQCGPRCPTGKGLGSALGDAGDTGPWLSMCVRSVPPGASSDPNRGQAPKPTGPYAVVCSWKVWRGIPTAGAGNGGTASPIRSIPACSLCPGIHHSPQTHPGLCQPQQGILTRPSLESLSLLTTSLPTALG